MKPKTQPDLKALLGDDDEDIPPAKTQPKEPVLKETRVKTPSPAENASGIDSELLVSLPEASLTLADYFGVKTKGGDRVQIIDRLGKDWEDCIAYHWGYRTIMHLKIKDLGPEETVKAVINFLNTRKQ